MVETLFTNARLLDPASGLDSPSAARPLPRPGDRIRVHLHPSGDGRAMPRDNLRSRGGFLLIHGMVAVITLINSVVPVQYRFGTERG